MFFSRRGFPSGGEGLSFALPAPVDGPKDSQGGPQGLFRLGLSRSGAGIARFFWEAASYGPGGFGFWRPPFLSPAWLGLEGS